MNVMRIVKNPLKTKKNYSIMKLSVIKKTNNKDKINNKIMDGD
jgi:hypothetical protein